MNRDPARHLYNLITQLEPSLAEPAAGPLERLISRQEAGEALIVAIVGPSGVGKSELVNRIAGTRVVTAGPLRPTTAAISVWGDVAFYYLPGARATAAPPLDRVALVDIPAAEHFPEAVARALDLVDVAILVVSADRYADAVVVPHLAAIEDRGVPFRVVLSSVGADAKDLGAIAADVEEKLGAPVAATMTGSVDSVRSFLDDLARMQDELIDQRDRGAAEFAGVRALAVAEALEGSMDEARDAFEKAGEALTAIRVDRESLAAVSSLDWGEAVDEIGELVEAASDEAIDAFRGSIIDNAAAVAVVDRSVESLPGVDLAPIEDWGRAAEEQAVASVNLRWLHWGRVRAVRDELWRLALDFSLRPSKKVRRALRDRLPDLRIDRSDALAVAMREAGGARTAAVVSALDPDAAVSPDDVRVAAEALRAAGRQSDEFQAGPDA
ncbi:MAG: GTPase domain-containing protein [Actinomycetota bacterium]